MNVYGLHIHLKPFSWFLIPCHVVTASKIRPRRPPHTLGQDQERVTLSPASRNGHITPAWPSGILHPLGQVSGMGQCEASPG